MNKLKLGATLLLFNLILPTTVFSQGIIKVGEIQNIENPIYYDFYFDNGLITYLDTSNPKDLTIYMANFTTLIDSVRIYFGRDPGEIQQPTSVILSNDNIMLLDAASAKIIKVNTFDKSKSDILVDKVYLKLLPDKIDESYLLVSFLLDRFTFVQLEPDKLNIIDDFYQPDLNAYMIKKYGVFYIEAKQTLYNKTWAATSFYMPLIYLFTDNTFSTIKLYDFDIIKSKDGEGVYFPPDANEFRNLDCALVGDTLYTAYVGEYQGKTFHKNELILFDIKKKSLVDIKKLDTDIENIVYDDDDLYIINVYNEIYKVEI